MGARLELVTNTDEHARTYRNGEVIVRKGDEVDCMYLVQSGEVVVFLERVCDDVAEAPIGARHLTVLRSGESFGEMCLFAKRPSSATLVARGTARVVQIDNRGFLMRVHEDPTIALRILRKLSERICSLSDEVQRLRGAQS